MRKNTGSKPDTEEHVARSEVRRDWESLETIAKLPTPTLRFERATRERSEDRVERSEDRVARSEVRRAWESVETVAKLPTPTLRFERATRERTEDLW